jgi:hypothetical protein
MACNHGFIIDINDEGSYFAQCIGCDELLDEDEIQRRIDFEQPVPPIPDYEDRVADAGMMQVHAMMYDREHAEDHDQWMFMLGMKMGMRCIGALLEPTKRDRDGSMMGLMTSSLRERLPIEITRIINQYFEDMEL